MSTENTIHLVGGFRMEEAVGSGVLKPGMIVELHTGGVVRAHSTEGGFAERAVVVEDALQGKTIDDVYANADPDAESPAPRILFYIENPGSVAQVFLKAGENVAIGTKLISSGLGSLIAKGSEASGTVVKQVLAIALEAKDLSASGAVDTRIAVRFV